MEMTTLRRATGALGLALSAVAAASAQTTTRASVGSSGAQADLDSTTPSISADGRYVAFRSLASNLVAGDTNGCADVFVRDRVSGTTERVSVGPGGAQSDGSLGSSRPSISADGRFVAFVSDATNLVAGDTNAATDVFVRDRQLGTTERASVDSGGAQALERSECPAISGDGRYVAFQSSAPNLVAGDTNGTPDVFVHDRLFGTTERVSVSSGGGQQDRAGYFSAISADGRFVAFLSDSTNLVAGDVNGFDDIFLRDRLSSTTELVSVASDGTQGVGYSGLRSLAISADGRFVAFDSEAVNLVAGDTNGASDVFVRDRTLGTTERASVSSSGGEGAGASDSPSMTGEGRFVAFRIYAPDLVAGDANGVSDVFVRDRSTGTTERASVAWSGAGADSACESPSISDDGSLVAFEGAASNLVPGDTNARKDVFVRDREGAADFTSLCHPGDGGVAACPCSNPSGGTGRGCDNSAATGGATLSASGATVLSSDSLVLTTSGERPTALSVVFQATASIPAGLVFGQGVRCAGGTLKRLYSRNASGGSITAPNFGAGEPSVSARSTAKGDVIPPGGIRFYFVAYRDPFVLGGCPATSTFNVTTTGRVTWSP